LSTVTHRVEQGLRVHAPKRLLALASDEQLAREMSRGNEAAFEVAYDRHSRALLSMCRHILGSQEEAEEALQRAFVSA
jgi:hypothetical protein